MLRDESGSAVFQKLLLWKAVDSDTSLHRRDSRKSFYSQVLLPSVDWIHCIFPVEDGSISSFLFRLHFYRQFLHIPVLFGNLL